MHWKAPWEVNIPKQEPLSEKQLVEGHIEGIDKSALIYDHPTAHDMNWGLTGTNQRQRSKELIHAYEKGKQHWTKGPAPAHHPDQLGWEIASKLIQAQARDEGSYAGIAYKPSRKVIKRMKAYDRKIRLGKRLTPEEWQHCGHARYSFAHCDL